MASTGRTAEASSSSSLGPHRSYEYDVFLSFRGEDTRKNFTDHVYNNLVAHGIRTFRDDEELQGGDGIKSGLSTAIQQSKIFVIIFSENYATSKWCLSELVMIIECTEADERDQELEMMRRRVLIPVFYHVQPTDVGHQYGSFEKAFVNHEKGADGDEEKKKLIEKWRIALQRAAKICGYHVDNQYETQIIQQIREDIKKRLPRQPLDVGEKVVGMDFHLKQLKALMKIERNDTYMKIGIYGIGGIGKTTIAMSLYNDMSSQFDGSSFLRVEGETSNRGLAKLQGKLLRDTLKQDQSVEDRREGINEIRRRLVSKSVLIVLDDVDKKEQLDTLAGKGFYGAKSVVIITTKDTGLLNQHGVDQFYEVKELNDEEAGDLFNWYAFKQSTTPITKEFKDLSDRVVNYAKGLPLALKVLGGFLSCSHSTNEWQSEIETLEKIPNLEVQNVLQASYNKLDDVNQRIFLDIACFFRGEDKDIVSRRLGRDAVIGIRVLQQRCLITINSENKLDMHDLLQKLGQEIVRRECPTEPGKRSRLWDHDDVHKVITRNTGTEAVEGFFMDVFSLCQIQFFKDSFRKMRRLRFLKVSSNYFSKIHLPMDFELSSFELRYFDFWGYPLTSLPNEFHLINLVELNLECSSIKQLWTENGVVLKNLKVMNLNGSKKLVQMPDFATVPNLEILNLSETAMKELPSSIRHLKALQRLYLQNCENLVNLPESIFSLRSLEELHVHGCCNLKDFFPDFKEDMENLRELDLSRTTIKELPSSIGHLKALQSLNLSGTAIKELPSSIEHLKALQSLDLSADSNDLMSLVDSVCNGSRLLDTLRVEKRDRISEGLEVCLNDNLSFDIVKAGIIWSNGSFFPLKTILNNLQYNCNRLMEASASSNHHILPLSSLLGLSIRNSEDGERIISPGGFHLTSLRVLYIGSSNAAHIGHIFHHSSLRKLSLRNCNLLGEVIPSNIIRNLSNSLVHLCLSKCNIREGDDIINEICELSSLEVLSLAGNHFSSIPAGINRLSNLRHLDLSHCKLLQDIPELPSSLRRLDAHYSDRISSSPSCNIDSLFNRLVQSAIQGTDDEEAYPGIVIPRNPRILEMVIGNQSTNCLLGRIELPQNWYENHDLLGFALHGVFAQVSRGRSKDQYEENRCLKCSLLGWSKDVLYWSVKLGFCSSGDCCCDNVSTSQQMWVLFYPKDAIEEEYRPNQWTHLTALFGASIRGYPLLGALECGIHLIYRCCGDYRRLDQVGQLKKLCLKGRGINELPPVASPYQLGSLCLRDCKHLRTLPATALCEFKSLTTLTCSGCSRLTNFPEISEGLENLRVLELDGTAITELPPSSIGSLKGLLRLNLACCSNLLSLPETICHLKSLQFLSCSGCSQLNSFPEIREDLTKLKELRLDGTAIVGLPTSIDRLHRLQYLNLENCSQLLSLPETICHLKSLQFLFCSGCSQLNSFPEIREGMTKLKELRLDRTAIVGLPTSIDRLHRLQYLNLENCSQLLSLPETICHLKSLEFLFCSGCSQLNSFPEIREDMTNEWRDLKASFHGEGLEVKECGFHFIYSEENNEDDEDNRMPTLLNLPESSGDNKSRAEDTLKRKRHDVEDDEQAQDQPQHNRLREEPNTDL